DNQRLLIARQVDHRNDHHPDTDAHHRAEREHEHAPPQPAALGDGVMGLHRWRRCCSDVAHSSFPAMRLFASIWAALMIAFSSLSAFICSERIWRTLAAASAALSGDCSTSSSKASRHALTLF